jgi:hypothetical protein
MSEFTIRSESVDVEQIMKQIRSRILEKRGADYTEEQVRELATVRLEKFLEPKNLRSDLLEQFRRSRPAVTTHPVSIQPPSSPHDVDFFAKHRGPLRFMRKLLNPLLKMMFNPNPLLHVMHKQAEFNVDLLKREARRRMEFDKSRAEWNALYYEVLHNLVLETTRLGVEVQNMRMRIESLSSRLDFSERRVRALEGVVQYRPEAVMGDRRESASGEGQGQAASAPMSEGFVPANSSTPPSGEGTASRRRRRRRRGRRGGGSEGPGGPNQHPSGQQAEQNGPSAQDGDPGDEDRFDGGDDGAPDDFDATPEAADEPSDDNQ